MAIRIQRLPEILHQSGDSRSAFYQKVGNGLWTRPVKIGLRSVGCPEHETEAILAARVAGKSDDQIRALVRALEASRRSGS